MTNRETADILRVELVLDRSGEWICRVCPNALEAHQWGLVLADLVRSLGRANLDLAKERGEDFDEMAFIQRVMANLVGEMVGQADSFKGPVPNLRLIDGGREDA